MHFAIFLITLQTSCWDEKASRECYERWTIIGSVHLGFNGSGENYGNWKIETRVVADESWTALRSGFNVVLQRRISSSNSTPAERVSSWSLYATQNMKFSLQNRSFDSRQYTAPMKLAKLSRMGNKFPAMPSKFLDRVGWRRASLGLVVLHALTTFLKIDADKEMKNDFLINPIRRRFLSRAVFQFSPVSAVFSRRHLRSNLSR